MNRRFEIRSSTKFNDSLPVFQRIQRFEEKNISKPAIHESNSNSKDTVRARLFQNQYMENNENGNSFETEIRPNDTNVIQLSHAKVTVDCVSPGGINSNNKSKSLQPCIETDKATFYVATSCQSNLRSSTKYTDTPDMNNSIGKTIPLPSVFNSSTFNIREDSIHKTDLICKPKEASGIFSEKPKTNVQFRNTSTSRINLNDSPHPDIHTQTNPRIFPIEKVQSNISINPVSSQLEKSENFSFTNKKAKNIYKPLSNRQTRYPVPSRSEHLQGSSTIRSFHQIKLKTNSSLNEASAKDGFPFQTHQNVKTVNNISDISLPNDKIRGSALNVNTIMDSINATSISKSTIGIKRLHSPNPIVSSNRTKSQTRIFVPEKMDFSQLSSDVHINAALKGCKTNNLDCHYKQTKAQVQHLNEIDNPRDCGIDNSVSDCLDIDAFDGAKCSTRSSHKTLSKQENILKRNNLTNDQNTININSTSSQNISTQATKLEHRKNIKTNVNESLPTFKANLPLGNNDNTPNLFITDIPNSKCQPSNYLDPVIPISILPEITVDPNIDNSNTESLTNFVTDKSLISNSVNLYNSHIEYSQLSDPNNFLSLNDNTPLSFARNDLQNWIKHTIDVKDAVTAAYLISSHIFEKTSHSIAQRHALERKEIQHVINDYKSRLSALLETNNDLLKKVNIMTFENRTTCTSSLQQEICHHPKVHRVISLPTRLSVLNSQFNVSPKDTVGEFSKSESNHNLVDNHEDSIGNFSSSKYFTLICPPPPPDLPEVMLKSIPPPPPNLPDLQDLSKTFMNHTELSTCMFQTLKLNKKQTMMKPLHWKRLCLPGRKNKFEIIWRSLPKPKIKSIELTLFEELFSKHKSRKNFKSMTNLKSHSTTVEEILPPNISRQVGVIFKNIQSVDIHLEDIAEMLYSGILRHRI
ncbi:hypothetical protein LOD99_15587 [Oopsacas minuta]|uniref:Uncharacterized protein n=1 Tax=Oopsacas minuta TaxID=111878 RepID=A0AAV7KAX4_9METZ|nr:hypothetical protein LOD99_15587 [Oopsacas minuta]